MNNLVLARVINILAQHDTIVKAETRISLLEHENVSDKARIESLENWVLKQDEQIKELEIRLMDMDENGVILKENKTLETLNKK